MCARLVLISFPFPFWWKHREGFMMSVSWCHDERPRLSQQNMKGCHFTSAHTHTLKVVLYSRDCFYMFVFSILHLDSSVQNVFVSQLTFCLLSSVLSHYLLFTRCAPHIYLRLSPLFLSYLEDELWHVRNSYQPACTLQHIRYRGKKLKEGGQGDAERRSQKIGELAAQTEFCG